jgi:hypothetical protein
MQSRQEHVCTLTKQQAAQGKGLLVLFLLLVEQKELIHGLLRQGATGCPHSNRQVSQTRWGDAFARHSPIEHAKQLFSRKGVVFPARKKQFLIGVIDDHNSVVRFPCGGSCGCSC